MNSKKSDQIEKLAHQAKNGDVQAFGEIFKKLSEDIYRFTFFQIENQIDAQDIVSETFKRAWMRLSSIKKGNLRAYLYRIAKNLSVDYFREKSKANFKKASEVNNLPNNGEGLGESLIKKQEIESLHKAFKKIPKNYREVIICRYIEELSIKETAKILNRSSIAVRVTQYRAIKKLRKILTYE